MSRHRAGSNIGLDLEVAAAGRLTTVLANTPVPGRIEGDEEAEGLPASPEEGGIVVPPIENLEGEPEESEPPAGSAEEGLEAPHADKLNYGSESLGTGSDVPSWVAYAPAIGGSMAVVVALVGFLIGRAVGIKTARGSSGGKVSSRGAGSSHSIKHTEAPAVSPTETVLQPANAATNRSAVRVAGIGRIHGQGAREYQQDSFGVTAPELEPTRGLLAVVADGMGGLSAGDAVSEAAVKAILDGFMAPQEVADDQALLLSLAADAISAVNMLLGPEGLRTGGSTLVMALVRGGQLSWLSIGDSHAYLLRDGALLLLTREHTYGDQLALRSLNAELPLSSALADPEKSALVNYLGMGALQAVDMPAEPLELRTGDRVILCSDGVYNAFSPGEMQALLAASPTQDPESLATTLERATAAKAWPDQDNFTAVIIGCE